MSYKIVVDSCCELPEELSGDERFQIIPLELLWEIIIFWMMKTLTRRSF